MLSPNFFSFFAGNPGSFLCSTAHLNSGLSCFAELSGLLCFSHSRQVSLNCCTTKLHFSLCSLLLIGLRRNLLRRIAFVNRLLRGGIGRSHSREGRVFDPFDLVVDVLAGAFVGCV